MNWIHFFCISATGLAWDTLLIKSNITLDLITDLKVLDIIERQKRFFLGFLIRFFRVFDRVANGC